MKQAIGLMEIDVQKIQPPLIDAFSYMVGVD